MATTHSSLPEGYAGREQAGIKHLLLRSYLEKLLRIIGMGARNTGGVIEICYVDAFAGPWGDNSEDLRGTSIAVSLETMAHCKLQLSKLGVNATMRALFIEREEDSHARLASFLATSTPAGVQAEARNGDFLDLRDDILKWCGQRAFAFFFVDPKGWKTVGVENLRPLLERPRSEFLINFMYDFINRTAAMAAWRQEIASFLGQSVEHVRSLDGQPPEIREAALVEAYCASIKRGLPTPSNERFKGRAAYVRVRDPVKDRTKYHLVYATCHPKGIIEFMQISQQVDLVQRHVRAEKRMDLRKAKSGMDDLFAGEAASPLADTALDELVDGFWLQYLSQEPRAIGEDEFADLLEATGWFPGDLQASLVRLIKAGHVRNLDAAAARRINALHYQKRERLVLLPLAR